MSTEYRTQADGSPCMWLVEEPNQFPVGQTALSLTCSIMKKSRIGLDDYLRMLQACFRKRMSDLDEDAAEDAVGLPDALDGEDERRLEDARLAHRAQKVEGGEGGEVGGQGRGVAEDALP